MKNSLISVIIPVYNCSEILSRTLESVINQTYLNLEILVIDDGSDVEIYPIIEKLNDKRIFYYKLAHQNANVSRNYGINKSKGKYIAMLDADDLWLDNHVESCLELLLKEQTDGIYGSLILKHASIHQENKAIARPLHKGETMIDYLLSSGYGAQTSTFFMTAESAKKILWNPKLNRHQDYDFIIRYSKEYILSVKVEPTTIYTLGEPKQLKIDFESCIRVIKENEEDISAHNYSRYHQNMLNLAIRQKAPNHIIEHYRKEVVFYKEYISYTQFLMIKYPKTIFEKLKCKLEYIFYILKIGSE